MQFWDGRAKDVEEQAGNCWKNWLAIIIVESSVCVVAVAIGLVSLLPDCLHEKAIAVIKIPIMTTFFFIT